MEKKQMIENEDFLHKILPRKISFEVRFVATFRPLRPSLDWASYWALSGRGRSSSQWTVVSSQHSHHRHRPPHRLVTSTQIVTLSDNTCIPYSVTTGDISDKNNHEHSLDTDCRLPLCRDWSHSSSSRALYFHQVLFFVPKATLWMVLTFVSRMWNKVFKSRFLKGLENQLIYYFYVLVAILILFFLDAIREMQKYSSEELQQKAAGGMSHLDAQMQMHMRLFRAQRNFYIAGWVTFHHHFVILTVIN